MFGSMFARILQSARFHWGGLVISLIAMILIIAPLVAFPFHSGEEYRGININHYGTDEDYYLARAKDVLDGHGTGQPFLAEGKNLTDPTFYKVEQVLMFPAVLFGLSDTDVVTWFNVANALGVFVLTLLVYAFAFALSKNRLLAATIAAFVIGGHTIIFFKTLFYDSFNIYGRSIFPYASSIPFFAFLLLLYQATVEKLGYLTAAGAGIFFGLLFYDYFYAWTFASALLGSFFLISLVTKNWRAVKVNVVVGLIGGLIAVPFLISFYYFFSSGEGAQIAYFLLAEHTRAFVMSILGSATLALFGLYLWRKPEDKNNPFILAIILAGWISLEQQMLSGRSIEYGHYYWYFIVPLSIIVGVYMVAMLLPKRVRPWLATLLILTAFVNSIGGQYRSFFTTIPEKLHDQEYAQSLQILQSLPYGVVLTGHGNESFPLLVTSYTSNDLYFTPSALVFHVSPERMQETLLTYLALNVHARKDPMPYLEQLLNATTTSPYKNLYRDIEGFMSGFDYGIYSAKAQNSDPVILEQRKELFSLLDTKYRDEIADTGTLRAKLFEDGVRYILWDKKFYPEWDLSPLEPLEKLNENGDILLFRLP